MIFGRQTGRCNAGQGRLKAEIVGWRLLRSMIWEILATGNSIALGTGNLDCGYFLIYPILTWRCLRHLRQFRPMLPAFLAR